MTMCECDSQVINYPEKILLTNPQAYFVTQSMALK